MLSGPLRDIAYVMHSKIMQWGSRGQPLQMFQVWAIPSFPLSTFFVLVVLFPR